MSVNLFFSLFFSDEAEFGIDEFSIKMKRKNVEITKWAKDSATSDQPSKVMKQIVPVSGVPFLSETRH